MTDLLKNPQKYTKRKRMLKIIFRLKVPLVIRPKMPVNKNIEKLLRSKKELSSTLLRKKQLGRNLGLLKKVSTKV